ncbi:MAG: DMT family transporter [Methylophagaceae bacterium]
MKTSDHINNRFAVVCLLFSASMWGVIWYPLRLLNDAGMSAVWSSLVMYLAAAVVAIPLLFKHAKLIPLFRADLLLLAVAAGITNVAFVVALIEGEVMRVMLLFYLSPLWTVLLGWWYLGERLSTSAIILFAVAMLGSLIMLWNPRIGWPWPHGMADWLALMASIAFSVNNILARKLALVPMGVKTGIVWWGVVVTAVLVLLWQQAPLPDVSLYVWSGAWLLGWLGIVVMTIAVLYGVGKMPVYRSAVIMLFELVVAALAAWWLTDEIMSLQEWLGGGLILLAAYGVAKTDS